MQLSKIQDPETIGDRYGGLIIVPGGSSLQTFVLSSTLLHSNKHTKKPESSFLELSDFFYRDTYRASRDTLLATVPVPMAPLSFIHIFHHPTNYELPLPVIPHPQA